MNRQGSAPESRLGIVEWLHPGEYERARTIVADMHELGITELRTHFSWAEWHTRAGQEWYDWLLPYLAEQVNLLPCFMYTPPSLGIEPKTSSPPQDLKAYADFIDVVITRFGHCFDWVELWNEPNNLNDWDWRIDPTWQLFAEMIGNAAHWAKQRGKGTVLGGMAPVDANWLDIMCRSGVMAYIDAIGVHGFPDTWEFDWPGWQRNIGRARKVLDRFRLKPQIWITEAGYSTWRHDEYRQVEELLALLDAPAERVYWYGGYDLHPDASHQDGFHQDERHYHFGLKTADGRPKLLYRTWVEGGIEAVRALAAAQERAYAELTRVPTSAPTAAPHDAVLITGGCGFVGINLADRLLQAGRSVLILDNLARRGAEANMHWLVSHHGQGLRLAVADIRDPHLVRNAVQQVGTVFHLAAQVAVTTSLDDPQSDFAVNAQGTLHVLEAACRSRRPPRVIFTSTNKVYGRLGEVALRARPTRYEPADATLRRRGIGEAIPLDFCSPYGCSKGAADQYVLDYGRTYGLPTVVLRMSCIYGPHQFGNEDQGWVAHFLINALEGRPLTIFGDGRQVRDVLFVADLVDALLLAEAQAEPLGPAAFNIGGGPANTLSLLELLTLMTELGVECPPVSFADWRAGDQRYYVSDHDRFTRATGWHPRWGVAEGVSALLAWLGHPRGSALAPVADWASARPVWTGTLGAL